MDHQDGEPPGQNAIAGGSRVVAGAGAMAALRTPPRLLFGVLFGLVAQEVAFYAGLFLTDASRVAVVPWPHVVTANVLSGFVLMGYLHRAARDQHPFGLSALRGHPLLTQGLKIGRASCRERV